MSLIFNDATGALQGIQVFKVESRNSEAICYVTVLNPRESSSPTDFYLTSLSTVSPTYLFHFADRGLLLVMRNNS